MNHKIHKIDSKDIENLKLLYKKGEENSGQDINNIYNKRFDSETYNTKLVDAETFFCDLNNKEMIDILKKYIPVNHDEYISNVHYINYGEGKEAKPHVDTGASIRTYVIMMNNEFEGGEFFLQKEKIKFGMGEMIEFNANITHSVSKITKGNREVLVVWLNWNNKNKISLL